MNIIFNSLNSLLQNIYSFTGDLGIAIICLTILVKLLLLPFSLKQRTSMINSQRFLKKQEELKEKYKNNSKVLEKIQMEYAQKSAKSMLGCFVSMLQIPIIFSLYSVVLHMPMQVSTIIVPWVSSLKASDSYFVIPIIYGIFQTFPSLLSYIKYLNILHTPVSKSGILLSSVLSLIITIKAPIAIGIYFITSSVFAFFEDLFFRIYCKKAFANT